MEVLRPSGLSLAINYPNDVFFKLNALFDLSNFNFSSEFFFKFEKIILSSFWAQVQHFF